MNRRPTGFTMIEIMVAITIIVILLSMLFVGFRRVAAGGQERSTRTTLENGRALLAEYERAVTSKKLPKGSATAPGAVTQAAGAQRYYGAVLSTRTFMAQMMALPAVKSAVGNIPPDTLTTWQWSLPTLPPPSVAAWGAGTDYDAGDVVSDTVGGVTTEYVALASHASAADNRPPASPWAVNNPSTQTAPVLLDAWRNPIIFVPAGGLMNVTLTASGTAVYRVASTGLIDDKNGDGDVTDYTAGPPVVSELAPSTARPFFASAGPDGDFTKGDDNLYSFEN